MSLILAALRRHAASHPGKVALQDEHGALTYGELPAEIARLADLLRAAAPRAVAILADNGKAWALADLAAHVAGIPSIPLPLFFSPAQLAHVLRTAAIDLVLTDQPQRLLAALQPPSLSIEAFHGALMQVRLQPAGPAAVLPAGTYKVTFTSGTTGEPKGVCLGRDTMETVAESLRIASAARHDDRHLGLLPLSTLLENIGGLYTPLLAGATICLPGLASVGLSGSSGLDAGRLLDALGDWHASTAIMVPQMLREIVAATRTGTALPHGLRYLAVGGAPVAVRLMETARTLGLPVHEGYGLSECASVVAVNRPDDSRIGSVGKPLPHLELAFADDGEILVRGLRWRGYLGEGDAGTEPDVIATGDLGYRDADGFLFITGRKKNMFVTAFGRNVAPEWVEGELAADPAIAQAACFGEARPFNCAVIVHRPGIPQAAIEAALEQANRRLPDYARVRAWIPAAEPFTADNGLSTPNGRLRRSAIFGRYAAQIDALYPS
ncbi:AMP-binding protein [Thiobacillus sp.]|uniref:AMP-binding protein n=1 Tax=Thiobacillus sp. TaxID=924 RepID=UPI00184F4682|nr:AMP-binding protein [Thiobacillus sp.]MBC2730799.1 long-chain fatty acid--CoA ligase [Thiobacillus sp.]MBC2739536.1 AMP-binding protein [Thiobacillus sp.]MBC2760180.1 AMP-binding protein [Thiobacillus sp.]